MISFSGVTKKYGDRAVLSSVSFLIDPGEFVFLIGKSGSGKTTIMRLLTAQAKHDEGEIKVAEMSLTNLHSRQIRSLRRMIGVIYQDHKLLPELTVAENIAMGLEILGKSREEIAKRTQELLGLIQLTDKEKLFPSQLSGGEAQRVCIARALATAPRYLFADEPTADLDEETARAIVRLLHKINELGTTIIMATHNISLIDKDRHRTIELKDGKATDTGKRKTSKK